MSLLHVLQPIVHYGLHFLAPGVIAWLLFRDRWKQAWMVMVATMLVDLDHLFAWPDVFVPNRCGIGFHPLHSYWAIAAYAVGCLIPNFWVRVISIGLLFHMATDFQDCLWMEALAQ